MHNMKKNPKSPGLKPLKGKNVAPKKMPKQVTNKSPQQFVLKNVPVAKKGGKMLASAMSKLSAKRKQYGIKKQQTCSGNETA